MVRWVACADLFFQLSTIQQEKKSAASFALDFNMVIFFTAQNKIISVQMSVLDSVCLETLK